MNVNAQSFAKIFGHLVLEATALLHPASVPPSGRRVQWLRLMRRCFFRLVRREKHHRQALPSPSATVATRSRGCTPPLRNNLVVKVINSQSRVCGAGPFLQLSNLVCGTSLQHFI